MFHALWIIKALWYSLFFCYLILQLFKMWKSFLDWDKVTNLAGESCESYFDCHCSAAAAAAKSLQSCPTLYNPIDASPPGPSVPGNLQARTLEWVAISFSNAWKWKVTVKSLSHVQLLATPWTAAYQAPPSMGFFQARVLVWGAIEQRHRAAKNKIISFKNRIHLSPSIQVLNILERF